MAGAYPRVASYPPLEQLSVISANQTDVSFTLNLNGSRTRPNYPFEVQLCVNEINSQEHPSLWTHFPLQRSALQTLAFRENGDSWAQNFAVTLSRQTFADTFSSSHLVFTFKYRVSKQAAWQWTTGFGGALLRGEIILQKPIPAPAKVESFMTLSSSWQAEHMDTTHEASLFSVQAGPIQNFERKVLGSVPSQARYFAICQIEPPWIGPRHGDDFLYIEEPAIMCSILRQDGIVVTIAAPSIGDVAASLVSNEKGQLEIQARDDGPTRQPYRVLLSIASDIETSVSAIMDTLRAEANNSTLVRDMIDDELKSTKPNSENLTPLLDNLGFCTWNALGLDLTEQKLLGALKTLRDHDVKISTLLVDDNWQTLGPTALDYSKHDFRGFADFKANEGFPHGLDGLTRSIRAENPSITEIGVWHGLLGYWGGFAKEGWIVDNYETVDVEGKMYYEIPAKLRSISASDLNRFYDDFYAELASSGITFVKTDVQSLLHDIKESPDRAALIPGYQAAWTMAHSRRLKGKAISCMSQIPETLWRGLLQNKTPPVIFRNSDDFFPEIPDSHPWHLWANAHNTIFTQHLNAILDWDMFQTSHEYGPSHAAARCLSGGPIFFTDVPGEHDYDLLDQVVAQSPDGRSIILRPSMKAKTSRAFDRFQESGLLKIITETTTGNKLMGMFNTRPVSLSSLVSTSEFMSFGDFPWKPKTKVIFFSHQTQSVRGPVSLEVPSSTDSASNSNGLIELDIRARGFEILSVYEPCCLSYSGSDCLVSVLGLLGKMTGAAAICSSNVSLKEGEIRISVLLKAIGTLGLWVSGQTFEKHNIRAELEQVKVDQDSISIRNTSHSGISSQIVSLDLIQAWSGRQETANLHQVRFEVIIGTSETF